MKKILVEDLKCPVCHSSMRILENDLQCTDSTCMSANAHFFIHNIPVLVNFEESLIEKKWLEQSKGTSVISREGTVKALLKKALLGETPATKKNIKTIQSLITENFPNPKILVVGGGTRGKGMDVFFEKYADTIDSFDIYYSENVNLIADGHDIPLKDDLYDIVIIQAVLEHVLSPIKVVEECFRVLKTGGVIYAETPFMQQVHEGPYDFTRFSESGHRYLFRKFELIDSGYVAGAGYTLLWSLDYFFSGIFRTKLAGKAIRLLFFWLKWFDLLIPQTYNIDAACGVFFIGKKSKKIINNKEIITHYKGNQK